MPPISLSLSIFLYFKDTEVALFPKTLVPIYRHVPEDHIAVSLQHFGKLRYRWGVSGALRRLDSSRTGSNVMRKARSPIIMAALLT
jgi:hypothetical protein